MPETNGTGDRNFGVGIIPGRRPADAPPNSDFEHFVATRFVQRDGKVTLLPDPLGGQFSTSLTPEQAEYLARHLSKLASDGRAVRGEKWPGLYPDGGLLAAILAADPDLPDAEDRVRPDREIRDTEQAARYADDVCANWPDGHRPVVRAYLSGLMAGREEAKEGKAARPDLWTFIRGVLLHGAGIERSCVDVPYETFSARMDVAARRLADEWQSRQAEKDTEDPTP